MKFYIKILFLMFFSVNAEAFTLNNNQTLTFGKNEVMVNVAAGNCANIGIDENELLTIISDAVNQYWNKAPTSRLKLRAGSIQSVLAAYKTEIICQPSTDCEPNPTLAVSSDVLITCNNNAANFSSAGVLAVTVPNNISGKTIIGSLIMINDLASNQFKYTSREEKVAIIAHELGHTFGLGHSKQNNNLMFFETVIRRKSLGADDIDGITYLYPKKQPVSCGSIETKNTPTNLFGNWMGLFIGLLITGLINYQLRYLKLRPRF